MPDPEGSVLVAVINSPTDLTRVRDEGWYRIPVARAPKPLASDYLALYLTAAFGEERWAVRHYAEVYRYQVMERAELLPSQPDHPRARELYYCLRLGPLQLLERPVPSRSWKRVTFIRTSMDRLLVASDLRGLRATVGSADSRSRTSPPEPGGGEHQWSPEEWRGVYA